MSAWDSLAAPKPRGVVVLVAPYVPALGCAVPAAMRLWEDHPIHGFMLVTDDDYKRWRDTSLEPERIVAFNETEILAVLA